MEQELIDLAKKVKSALQARQFKLITAESCTGGLLSTIITEIPGSSKYFEVGFVTYSDRAKQEILGVDAVTLEKFGAVSEEVAQEMAKGAIKKNNAQISVAISGIAGPSRGSLKKTIGTVCFAFIIPSFPTKTFTMRFVGDRISVRIQAVSFTLKKLLELLNLFKQ